jgi:periplasmic protein TonB
MSSHSSTNPESDSRVPPTAFSQCLVEPDPATAARIRHRRHRALGISAFLEVSFVAALLIWPLFATGSKLVRRVYIPIPPYGVHHAPTRPPVPEHPVLQTVGVATVCRVCFRAPKAPNRPYDPVEQTAPGPQVLGPNLGVGTATTESSYLIDVISNETGPAPPKPDSPQPHTPSAPIRRSEGVQSALLIHRVDPRYPPLCFQARREGTVQLHAVIARDGSIQLLEVLSGDPLFIRDALDAVRQWRYRPTLLGGEPVEVETFITVNFRLSH